MDIALFALRLALYVLPMYFANAFAMLGGGGILLDFGRRMRDGNPVLGSGKTMRGTAVGIVTGFAVTLAVWWLVPEATMLLTPNYVALGVLISVGAVAGDIAASFLKRRLGIPRGKDVLIIDQLDFVAGGIMLGSVVFVPSASEIAAIAIGTVIIHKASNFIAYKARLKRVPW